jgi:hypothetical protein
MDGLIAAVLSLAIIALGIDASTCYFKRIRDDQADPVSNPTWKSDMRWLQRSGALRTVQHKAPLPRRRTDRGRPQVPGDRRTMHNRAYPPNVWKPMPDSVVHVAQPRGEASL